MNRQLNDTHKQLTTLSELPAAVERAQKIAHRRAAAVLSSGWKRDIRAAFRMFHTCVKILKC